MFTIYCHTHDASQKRYVGQTKQGAARRWKEHVNRARRGAGHFFHSAIRKYGANAFTLDVLEQVATQDEADDAEQWWIAHFGSDDRTIGYNLSAGGKSHREIAKAARASQIANTTKEERSAGRRKAWEAKSPEQRREWTENIAAGLQRHSAAMTLEEREKRSRITQGISDARTAEERSEISRRSNAAMTPEARSERSRSGHAKKTAEQRGETMRKIWATRRISGNVSRSFEASSTAARKAWVTRRQKASSE